jgi:hypothetical protein
MVIVIVPIPNETTSPTCKVFGDTSADGYNKLPDAAESYIPTWVTVTGAVPLFAGKVMTLAFELTPFAGADQPVSIVPTPAAFIRA